MVVQAVSLLDDLDKEINIYAMRVKEWYGWHFPEMAKIIVDNLAYAKVVRLMGRVSPSYETFAYLFYRIANTSRRYLSCKYPSGGVRGRCQARSRNLDGHRDLRIGYQSHTCTL